MSSSLGGLLSVTFYEPGYDHLVELIHQRDVAARRRLDSLAVAVYDDAGKTLAELRVDPQREILDLAALVAGLPRADGRVMVTFDARYDERVFPYRPHHYAYLHRRGAPSPSLYYAVNAVLGGVPDRIGATNINNFETYLFLRRPLAERYAVLLGNPARFSAAEIQVLIYHERERTPLDVTLAPKAHAEVPLPAERDGRRLHRVEVKAPFRLASYVVGRAADSADLVLFDHLFTYSR